MLARFVLLGSLLVVVSIAFGCHSGQTDSADGSGACYVRPEATPALSVWPDDPTMLHPAPAPSSSSFVRGAHAAYPAVPNHGYTPPAIVRLEVITTPNDPLAASLGDFAHALATSTWWKTVAAEYGLPPTIDTVMTTTGPAIEHDLREADLGAYVHGASAAPPDAPDGSALTIRIVFLPPGVDIVRNEGANCDCSLLGGAHFHSKEGDVVGYVQRCPASASDGVLDLSTRIASHEIVEAATDPIGAGRDGYFFSPTSLQPGVTPPLAFQTGESRLEVADLCNQTAFEGPWAYARSWSNAKATAGEPPCVPYVSSEPYFNTTTSDAWYAVDAGGSVTIQLDAWSEIARPDWYVMLAAYYPVDAPFRASIDTARSETLGSHTYRAMNNGEQGKLTVTAPSDSDAYVVITLVSRSVEPSTNHTWHVGVYVR